MFPSDELVGIESYGLGIHRIKTRINLEEALR